MKIKLKDFNKIQTEQMLECEKLQDTNKIVACKLAVSDLAQTLRKKAGLFGRTEDVLKVLHSGELKIDDFDFKKATDKGKRTCYTLLSPIPMSVDEIRSDPKISSDIKKILIKQKSKADKEVKSCEIGVDSLAESIERKFT